MDLPLYFPNDYNRRLAGLQDPYRKKFSVVFQDFGRCGHVDVGYSDNPQSGTPTFIAQRQHSLLDRSRLCAQTPTLPLSDTPIKVDYPFQDPVIGDLPELPAKVTKFSRSLTQIAASHRQGAKWSKLFLGAKKTLDGASNPQKISSFKLQVLGQNLPGSVLQLTDMYTDLSQRSLVNNYNPRYSGGLLSCVTQDSASDGHFLFHATGRKLNRLTLTHASLSESDSQLAVSQILAKKRTKSVYQVNAASFQDHVFVGTRHEDSCALFSVPARIKAPQMMDETDRDSSGVNIHTPHSQTLEHSAGTDLQFTLLGTYSFDDDRRPTSISVSPYLPGEALLCADSSTIYIWNVSDGVQRTIERLPRFECRDSWLHAYYGCHPRHIVLADRTAVQMIDHRDSFRSSVDLFSLPSKLVHKNECIMAAHHHGKLSPLHMVATSHGLFLVDQRFAGTPVMQWYPDFKGPVQYLASADYFTDQQAKSGVVLAGSQHPAEVMCYPFNHGSGHAVTVPLTPWRLSRMNDIGDTDRYHCFLGEADASVFQERLGLSLAGMAVAPGRMAESLVTYQVDPYGEIYFQQYSMPDNPRITYKTGVPAAGKRDDYVSLSVQDRVKSWLQRLQEQIDALCDRRKHRKQTEGRKIELPPSSWLMRDEDCSSMLGENQKCSFCGDDIDTHSPDHSRDNRLLCRECHAWHSGRSNISQSGQTLQPELFSSGGGRDCTDAGPANDGQSFLDGVVPHLDNYETDPDTNVMLALMTGESQILEKVKKREEERSWRLESWKDENRSTRERKKRKRQAAEEDELPTSIEDISKSTEHSFFSSAEHQKQNVLIDEVLAKTLKTQQTVTISHDIIDGESLSNSDSENTAPKDDSVDQSFDLFQDSEEEVAMELENSQSQSLFQDDDDDEFFSSQDLDLSQPVAVSQKERRKENANMLVNLEQKILTPIKRESLSVNVDQNQSQRSSRKQNPVSSPSRVSPPSSKESRTAGASPPHSPVLKPLALTPSSQSAKTLTLTSPQLKKSTKFFSPSVSQCSPFSFTTAKVVTTPQSDFEPFTQVASPMLTPKRFKANSVEKNTPHFAKVDITTSPYQKLSAPSERRKPKTAKKSRRSLLSGF